MLEEVRAVPLLTPVEPVLVAAVLPGFVAVLGAPVADGIPLVFGVLPELEVAVFVPVLVSWPVPVGNVGLGFESVIQCVYDDWRAEPAAIVRSPLPLSWLGMGESLSSES